VNILGIVKLLSNYLTIL